VPLSIVIEEGTEALDGRNPTIVYGYGAYGRSTSPTSTRACWPIWSVAACFAVAHVRGGGGLRQRLARGRQEGDQAQHLEGRHRGCRMADRQRLDIARRPVGIYGGSAGGIFVGRAITERPDLFAAAVPLVGVMDAMRFETSANGVANIPEFGSVKDEAGFKALLAMSSLHHVKDGVRYPAVLLSHGVNDIRVDVWNSSKFASRVVQAQQGLAGTRPVLLRLEYEAGHGSGSTRAQAQERSADIYAFFLWQFGAPGFQPRQP
jgi:prolyl oligopeptidase